MSGEEVEALGIFPRSPPGIIFGPLVLDLAGRDDEIDFPGAPNTSRFGLSGRDLRFSAELPYSRRSP